MAKKNVETKNIESDIKNNEALSLEKNQPEINCGTASSYDDITELDIKDLVAYEQTCKLLCSIYEKEIKLNELETRNYTPEIVKYNRERYQYFTMLYRKLCKIMENKLEKLEQYENFQNM